jgi:multidrug efflux pump subunit AcrA (membrane-fusion protein)
VLVRIDPRDYETALAQAKAQVAQAEAGVANLDAQINAQNARIEQAQEQVRQTQAAFEFARDENTRAQQLLETGAVAQHLSLPRRRLQFPFFGAGLSDNRIAVPLHPDHVSLLCGTSTR